MSHNMTCLNVVPNACVTPHQVYCQKFDSVYTDPSNRYCEYNYKCSFEDNLPYHREFECLDINLIKGLVEMAQPLNNTLWLHGMISATCCNIAIVLNNSVTSCYQRGLEIKASINRGIERCKNITMALHSRTSSILLRNQVQACEEKAKSSMHYNNIDTAISSANDQIGPLLSIYRVLYNKTSTSTAKLTEDALMCSEMKKLMEKELGTCNTMIDHLKLIDQESQRNNTALEKKTL